MGSAKRISSSFRRLVDGTLQEHFLFGDFLRSLFVKDSFGGGGGMSPGFFFCKIATPWKRDDDPKRQLFQSPRVTVLDSGLQTKKGFLRNRIYVGCGLLTATGTRNISFSVRDLCKPSFSHETMRICPVVCKELRSSDWFVVFD